MTTDHDNLEQVLAKFTPERMAESLLAVYQDEVPGNEAANVPIVRSVKCKNCHQTFDWPEPRNLVGYTCHYHPENPSIIAEANGERTWEYGCCGQRVRSHGPPAAAACVHGRHHGYNEAIFISYARADTTVVTAIVNRLRDTGFHVWLDQSEIQVGTRWQEQLERTIAGAAKLVLFMSEASASSVWVHRELMAARKLKKIVLIFSLDGNEHYKPYGHNFWVVPDEKESNTDSGFELTAARKITDILLADRYAQYDVFNKLDQNVRSKPPSQHGYGAWALILLLVPFFVLLILVLN